MTEIIDQQTPAEFKLIENAKDLLEAGNFVAAKNLAEHALTHLTPQEGTVAATGARVQIAEASAVLAVALSELGNPQGALEQGRRVTATYEGLRKGSEYRQEYAASLSRLSVFLDRVGDKTGAQHAGAKAVSEFRKLVRVDSVRFLPLLAASQHNYANSLSFPPNPTLAL